MSCVLVAGLINLETTLRVDAFPVGYCPVRYPFWGIATTVSGVGYNVAKALTVLGDEVRLVSLVGEGDPQTTLVREALARDGIGQEFVLAEAAQTAQSVILYDGEGRRQIHVDLKDLQERTYPEARFAEALEGVDLAVLCNINFSRPFLQQARQRGIPIATDVHTLSDLEDGYNRDFMTASDILFMSNEQLPEAPEVWARRVLDRYSPSIVVIGMGAQGALLATRDGMLMHVPAVVTRPIVNTIGAGDALFSAFIHFYAQGCTPQAALERAVVFASYKIGAQGAAEGFLDEVALERRCNALSKCVAPLD